MAENNVQNEVRKILGKRRSAEGTEYLILLKGQRKGQERWINYRQLLNSKRLLKEYNLAQRCKRQRKQSAAAPLTKEDLLMKDGKSSSDNQMAENSFVGFNNKTAPTQQEIDSLASNGRTKDSQKKCKTKKGVSEFCDEKKKYKLRTQKVISYRNDGTQQLIFRKTIQSKCINSCSNNGKSEGIDKIENVMDLEKISDDSVSSLDPSDTSDSEEILYSLADPDENDDGESIESSMTTSDSEDILYSLADPFIQNSLVVEEKSGIKSHMFESNVEDTGTYQLNVLGTLSPATDSEATFKMSPSEIISHNHMTDMSESSQPGSQASSSALSAISKAVKSHKHHASKPSNQTLPQPTCGTSHREPSPSLASTNNLPQIPQIISTTSIPSLPSYDAFIRTFSKHHPSRRHNVKRQKGGDSDVESVQRRISVRNSESTFKYKQIMVKKHQHYTQIWLSSQTKRKNALNPKVFQELITALRNAETDDTHVILLTGSSHVFCSGIDLQYLITGDIRQAAIQMAESLKEFMRALMLFPKPIVAAVNGSAVGLGVGLLPLCDVIYASDKASFYCPYTKLGHTPEGGASYMFPQTLGIVKANELLLEGRKITAQEASQIGLVSQVFWPTSMMQEVIPRVQQMAQMSAEGLEATKFLIRGNLHSKLEMTINTECDMLGYLWASTQCQNAMTAFLNEDEDLMF